MTRLRRTIVPQETVTEYKPEKLTGFSDDMEDITEVIAKILV